MRGCAYKTVTAVPTQQMPPWCPHSALSSRPLLPACDGSVCPSFVAPLTWTCARAAGMGRPIYRRNSRVCASGREGRHEPHQPSEPQLSTQRSTTAAPRSREFSPGRVWGLMFWNVPDLPGSFWNVLTWRVAPCTTQPRSGFLLMNSSWKVPCRPAAGQHGHRQTVLRSLTRPHLFKTLQRARS